MSDDSLLVIQPLNTRHDRAGFRCGVAALDTYLARQARQDVKRRISRVFVAASAKQPNTVLGYYTLSSLAVEPAIPAAAVRLDPGVSINRARRPDAEFRERVRPRAGIVVATAL